MSRHNCLRTCALLACLALAALATAPAALGQGEPKEPGVAAGGKKESKKDVKFSQATPDTKKEAAGMRTKVKADKAKVKAARKEPVKSAETYFKALEAEAAKLKKEKKPLPPNLQAVEKTKDDKNKRKGQVETYEQNLVLVDKLNDKSGEDLAFGLSDTMHMTDEEFRAAYTTPSLNEGKENYLPEDANGTARDDAALTSLTGGGRRLLQSRTCYSEVGWSSSGQSANSLLTNIDWRTASPFSTVTPVKNQGACGSCVAFGSMVGVEAGFITKWRHLGYTSSNTDLSEQEQMRCLTGNQCNGASISQLGMYLDRATCRGVAFESAAPYVAADNNVCPSTSAVPRYISGITRWTAVPKDINSVRRALAHNPVAIVMRAGFDNFRFYGSGVWPCTSSSTTDHMTAVVAYRNAVPMANGQTWKVFTVKNSWGANWGENGYFHLRADCSAPGSLGMYAYKPLLALKG